MNIQLEQREPLSNNVDELATVLLARFGLLPRKRDSQATIQRVLLELVEKKKTALRDKQPELAIMTVEDMGHFASIARQTMYDYLSRWLDLNILKKASFVASGKVVIGYELNGPTLEAAFRKAETVVKNHFDASFILIEELGREIKKRKLSESKSESSDSSTTQTI